MHTRWVLAAGLLVAATACASGDDESFRTTIDGMSVTGDSVEWDPEGRWIEATGHVSAIVPDPYQIFVRDAEGTRSWVFLPGMTATIRADRVRVDVDAHTLEAEGNVHTTLSGEETITIEEPAMVVHYRSPELVENLGEGDPR